MHVLSEESGTPARMAVVERGEIGAPDIEFGGTLRSGTRAVVGDVVDQTAELVDGEHRLALGLGHDAHGGVERAARDPRLQGCVVSVGRHPNQPIATLKAPRSETPAASIGR